MRVFLGVPLRNTGNLTCSCEACKRRRKVESQKEGVDESKYQEQNKGIPRETSNHRVKSEVGSLVQLPKR
jgi:hypothetical protein